jgi:DNA repair protein RadC
MTNDSLESRFNISEIEITYRNKTPFEGRIKVDTPWKAFDILRSSWDDGKIELLEQFKILILDHKCNCLGISLISSGGTSACTADPKIVFMTAFMAKAERLILAHNHPSGSLKPSEPDMYVTKIMAEAGKLLEIPVVDRLIITSQGYYSFADHGAMPGWQACAKPRTSYPSLCFQS